MTCVCGGDLNEGALCVVGLLGVVMSGACVHWGEAMRMSVAQKSGRLSRRAMGGSLPRRAVGGSRSNCHISKNQAG